MNEPTKTLHEQINAMKTTVRDCRDKDILDATLRILIHEIDAQEKRIAALEQEARRIQGEN